MAPRDGGRPAGPTGPAGPPRRLGVTARLAAAFAVLGSLAVLLARAAPGDGPRGLGDVVAWLGRGRADLQVVSLATVAAWACIGRLAYALLAVWLASLRGRAVPSRDAPPARRLAVRILGASTLAAVVTSGVLAAPAYADGPDGPFSRPVAAPAAAAPLPPSRASPRVAGTVLVRAGDTLWRIAATAWPRWYAANRAVIGDDPDLILPGQRLVPPAADPGGVR